MTSWHILIRAWFRAHLLTPVRGVAIAPGAVLGKVVVAAGQWVDGALGRTGDVMFAVSQGREGGADPVIQR